MATTVLGTAVKRLEDPELLNGKAQFIADVNLPGMLHLAILYSSEAHALIEHIDTSVAEKMPGVVRVFTGADIVDKGMPLPVIWKPAGVESFFPPHPYGLPGAQTMLATDRVRYVGEFVAVVAAETRKQAYAALDAIKVAYEPLPAVFTAEEALQPGAPQLHETVAGNLNAHVTYGDQAATEQAITNAEVVVQQKITNPRQIHNAIETRGSIGNYEPETGEYTLWTNTQIPGGNRFMISQLVLGIPYNKLRVIVPNIGGAYGSKGYLYADAPLVLVLSKELGRPVKWIDTRTGLARSTVHARGQVHYATIAGNRDGKITALKVTSYAGLGGYSATNGPGAPTVLTGRSITGAYAIPNPFYEVYTAYVNMPLVGPARGAGRNDALFTMERMIDLFADEIGMDPAEVRRKNYVQPDQFPYENRLGWTYDTGNYEPAMNRALEMIGYDKIADMKAEARQRGKRLGVGVGSYVTIGGVGPSSRMGQEGLIGSTWAVAIVRVHQTGDVTVITGAQPHGQSQVTTFAQIASQELGVDLERIEVLHSDTFGVPYAQGSYGSRTYSVEGAAIYNASQKIKAKALTVGAHMLKTSEDAVEYVDGQVRVKANPEQAIPLQGIASALWFAWDLPADTEPGLEATVYFDPKDFNFPFGSHAALVEIDEQTGLVNVVKYVAVDDVGNVGNPNVVDGQMIGNIEMGIGQALWEGAAFDEHGRVISDSFREYAMPRPSRLPNYELDRTVTPTPLNPMGAKGAGDVSNPVVTPTIINAVVDALSDLGVRHFDWPVTAEKVWRVLQGSSEKGE